MTLVDHIPVSVVVFGMLGFGCYFALGGLLREIVRDGWSAPRLAYLLVAAASGLVEIDFNASKSLAALDAAWLPHAAKALPAGIWLASCAVIYLSARFNDVAWRCLGAAAPAVRLLGLATYPLYLLHESVANVLRGDPFVWTPIAASAVAVAVSVLVAATIEPWAQSGVRALVSGGVSPPSRRRLAGPPDTLSSPHP